MSLSIHQPLNPSLHFFFSHFCCNNKRLRTLGRGTPEIAHFSTSLWSKRSPVVMLSEGYLAQVGWCLAPELSTGPHRAVFFF